MIARWGPPIETLHFFWIIIKYQKDNVCSVCHPSPPASPAAGGAEHDPHRPRRRPSGNELIVICWTLNWKLKLSWSKFTQAFEPVSRREVVKSRWCARIITVEDKVTVVLSFKSAFSFSGDTFWTGCKGRPLAHLWPGQAIHPRSHLQTSLPLVCLFIRLKSDHCLLLSPSHSVTSGCETLLWPWFYASSPCLK